MAVSIWKISNLLIFEIHISRKIFGPDQCKERWRIRSNKILKMWIKERDINKYTKIQKVK
jgi:hypothetical protein